MNIDVDVERVGLEEATSTSRGVSESYQSVGWHEGLLSRHARLAIDENNATSCQSPLNTH